MYLPDLRLGSGKLRRQTVEFGGLNYTQNIREGELADSRGVSSESWPCLTQRKGRKRMRLTDNCQSLYAWDKLVTVEGTELRYDGQVVGTVTPGEKQFAVVNTKLCIFPDKKYLDLTTREMGMLEAKAVNPGNTWAVFEGKTLTMEREAVVERLMAYADVRLPTQKGVNDYRKGSLEGVGYVLEVFETLKWEREQGRWTGSDGGDPQGVGVYLVGTGTLAQLRGKKVLLKDTGISGGYALNLKKVKEVMTYEGGGKYVTTRTVEEDFAPYDSQGFYGVIEDAYLEDETAQYLGQWSAGRFIIAVKVLNAAASNPGMEELFSPGDRVTISGCSVEPGNDREHLRVEKVTGQTITFSLGETELFTSADERGAVTICREVPDLDYICESGNRLFGVSSAKNTIYASALGDPKNFWIHDGVSTDSYCEEVGTHGDFTGCCGYGGAVLFWKEDCLHRLVGSYPAAYEVYTDHIPGLQAGSGGSLVMVNETLYYKGRGGIYAYAGGIPKLISGALGNVRYEKAAAGSDGERYYISMRRTDTKAWELLVYDLQRGLWIKEDELEALAFTRLGGTVYMLQGDGVYALGVEDDPDSPVAWEATLAPFFEGELRRKYPSRLLLRLELEPGSWVEAQLSRDQQPFRPVWSSRDHHALTAVVPIRPGRCDRYQLRLKGEGRCLVRSLAREFSLGGVK